MTATPADLLATIRKQSAGADFDAWYAVYSKAHGTSPDPDDPQHEYDYRAFYDKYKPPVGYVGDPQADHKTEQFPQGEPRLTDEFKTEPHEGSPDAVTPADLLAEIRGQAPATGEGDALQAQAPQEPRRLPLRTSGGLIDLIKPFPSIDVPEGRSRVGAFRRGIPVPSPTERAAAGELETARRRGYGPEIEQALVAEAGGPEADERRRERQAAGLDWQAAVREEVVEEEALQREAFRRLSTGETPRQALLKGASEALYLAMLFPQTWGSVGSIGAGSRLGPWGRAVAEGALGGGTEVVAGLAAEEPLEDVLKRGAVTAGIIGAIPGAGPALREARAGLQILAKPIIPRIPRSLVAAGERARAAVGRVPVAETAVAGLQVARGIPATAGARQRVRAARLRDRTQDIRERAVIAEDRAAIDAATVGRESDDAITRMARAETPEDLRRGARKAAFNRTRDELDDFAQRLFDEPADAMQNTYRGWQDEAHARWLALRQEERLLRTRQRQATLAVARAEGLPAPGRVRRARRTPDEQARLSAARAESKQWRDRLGTVREAQREVAWARDLKQARRRFPDDPELLATVDREKRRVQNALWAEAEARWSPETVAELTDVYRRVVPRENAMGKLLLDAALMDSRTAARWHDVHLRRVVPFFRGGNLDEMLEFLRTHGPEHLGQLEARIIQKKRLTGVGRGPLSIPSAVRAPRKLTTPEVPEFLGTELVTFGQRVTTGERLASQSAIRATGLRQIAQGMSISEEQFYALSALGRSKYVPVSSGSKTLGELAGRFVEMPVFKVLQDWERSATTGERLISGFKAMKVVLSPAVWAHNIITNKVSGMLEYGVAFVNPKNAVTAIRELAADTGLWRQHRDTYPLGASLWARAELRQGLRSIAKETTWAKMLNGLREWTLRKPSQAYGAVELIEKWTGARLDIAAGRAGGAARAFARADRTFINYGRMPEFIMAARRSPLGTPFVSFVWGISTRTIPHWARRHPGKLWTFFRAPHAITDATASRDRVELEKALMPEWMTPDLMVRIGADPRDGAGLWIDLSRLTPFADVARTSVLALHEFLEDLRSGGPGVGLDAIKDFATGIASPIYRVPHDIAMVFEGKFPTVSGYRDLEDTTPAGKARAIAGIIGKTAAPGFAVDFYRVMTAKEPAIRIGPDGKVRIEEYRRGKFLEAVRAAGIPVIRVRPDLGFARAMGRWGDVIEGARKAELFAKTPTQKRYWSLVRTRAERRMNKLIEYYGAAESLADMEPLPLDASEFGLLEDQEEEATAAEASP